MPFVEKTLKSKIVHYGKILNVRHDTVIAVNQKESIREIIEHSGGVAILAVTNDKKVILIEQFRQAANKIVLEIPAGKLEAGEDPKEAGIRELKEETGFTANKMEYVCEFYSSIGYSEEVIYLYLATELLEGETNFDETESIDTKFFSFAEIAKMIDCGEIIDAKTIIALQYLITKNLSKI